MEEDSSSAPAPAPFSSPNDDAVVVSVKPSYSDIVQGNGGPPPLPPPPHLHLHHHHHLPPPHLHPPFPPPPPPPFRVLPETPLYPVVEPAEMMDFVDAPDEALLPPVSGNGHGSLYYNKEEVGDGYGDVEDEVSSVESFDSAQERISLIPVSSADYEGVLNTVHLSSFSSSVDEVVSSELVKDTENQSLENQGSGVLVQNVNNDSSQIADAEEAEERIGIHTEEEAPEEPVTNDPSEKLDYEKEGVVENYDYGAEEPKVTNDSSPTLDGDGKEVAKKDEDDKELVENDGEVPEEPKLNHLLLMAGKEVADNNDNDAEVPDETKMDGSSETTTLGAKEVVDNDGEVLEEPEMDDSSQSTLDAKEVVYSNSEVPEEEEGEEDPKMVDSPQTTTLDAKAVVDNEGEVGDLPKLDPLLALDAEEVVENQSEACEEKKAKASELLTLDAEDVARNGIAVSEEPKRNAVLTSDAKELDVGHPMVTNTNDSLALHADEVAETYQEVSEEPKSNSLLSSDVENYCGFPVKPKTSDPLQALEGSKVNDSVVSNAEKVKEDDGEVQEILSNMNHSDLLTLNLNAEEVAVNCNDDEIINEDTVGAGKFNNDSVVPLDIHPTSEEIKEYHSNGSIDDTTTSQVESSCSFEKTGEEAIEKSVTSHEDAIEGKVDSSEVNSGEKEETSLEADHNGIGNEATGNLKQCQTDETANLATVEGEEIPKRELMDEFVDREEENTDNNEEEAEAEEKTYGFSITSGEMIESLIAEDMPSNLNQEPLIKAPGILEVDENSGVKIADEVEARPREEVIVEGDEIANAPPTREENKKTEEIMKPKNETEGNPKSSTGQSSTNTPTPTVTSAPAGLGSSIPSLEATSRISQRGSGRLSRQALVPNEENQSNDEVSEGGDEAREKLHQIRVKFLRLAHRLGQSAHNVVVAQVLYRLGLAEQLRGGQSSGRAGSFSFERASLLAEEQESAGAEDLDFGCTIMVLGKSGVGKSATINSLFDEIKTQTNAYSLATNKVKEIVGTIHGIKLRVIDTPGLLTSFGDQPRNQRIMSSVKRYIKKSPPDIVLYFDRLDIPSRDYGDLPLLRTITDTFGAAVWFNAIVVLTHASSAPPDGANGVPVSYEMFVAQRSHIVQQTIRQAAGDMRLMNPVSLVENHDSCRRNRSGQRVLPNGQVWKPQLLLLCFASKILAEANSLLKLQDNTPTKPFGVRSRVPPLPFLLSSLLQSRAPLKLPDDQMGGDEDDDESSEDEESDSDGEEDYDDLPPFRRLTKDELNLLDKEQKKIYFEELEYRERLFIKKQLKEERIRKKEMKRRMAALPKDVSEYVDEGMDEEENSSAVAVPMPDMALPPSFDSDNPTYRYRYLDMPNQFLVRPVLETHGWDHDSGYDGINVEKMFVVSKKIPASVSGQITKDKKEANLQMECAASFKNGANKVSQAGLDIQTIGKDLAYTFRGETKFSNFKRNKTTCGLSVTVLGDTVAGGMKVENHKMFGKRAKLVVNGGALTSRSDVAYGGSLEATIRDKDYPIGQFMSTLGLSVMNWHGDLAIGGNLQVQLKAGKTMLITRGNLNNRGAGQVTIRASSAEQVQMALIGLIPLLRTLINSRQSSSN